MMEPGGETRDSGRTGDDAGVDAATTPAPPPSRAAARRTRSNDFVVGAAIILTLVAVLAAVLWAKQTDVGRRRTRVEARFRDVGGVQVGNAVVIRGVRAGRVERIELADGGWVIMRLRLDRATRLPPEPVVLLSESSLFGEWQATITDRAAVPPDREVLRQVADADIGGGVLPGAVLPDIAKLTTVAGRMAGDLASVASRVEVAFNDTAATELRASIRNVANLSAQLATTVRKQSRNLDSIALDLREGVGSVRQSAATVQRVAGRIDESTSSGELRHIVDDFSASAAQLRATTARLDSMSRRLDRTQLQAEAMLARTDTVMMKINSGRGSLGLLVNDPSLYRNGDTLLIQLRKVVADFQQNPKKYVRIKLF